MACCVFCLVVKRESEKPVVGQSLVKGSALHAFNDDPMYVRRFIGGLLIDKRSLWVKSNSRTHRNQVTGRSGYFMDDLDISPWR